MKLVVTSNFIPTIQYVCTIGRKSIETNELKIDIYILAIASYRQMTEMSFFMQRFAEADDFSVGRFGGLNYACIAAEPTTN